MGIINNGTHTLLQEMLDKIKFIFLHHMFTTSTSPFYLSNISQGIITGKGIKKGLYFIFISESSGSLGGGGDKITRVHRFNPRG